MKRRPSTKLPGGFEAELRKLKAIVSIIIYGLLLLLLKTLYEAFLNVPDFSVAALISFLAFLLVLVIFLFNQHSRNIIKRITAYTTALEDARRFSMEIIDTVQYPLLVLDAELRIILANRAFHRTFRIDPAETKGEILYKLGNNDWDIPQLRDLPGEIFEQKGVLKNFELEHKFSTIGVRILLLTARRVSVERKRIFLLSIEDITHRKMIERELKNRTVQLEAAGRAKSDFLARVSHELRTPLNAIIGFSEILKDGMAGTLEPDQEEYINDIFSSGEHLLSLINDILDLSKIEAGKMSLDLEKTDIPALLKNSLSVVKEKAGAHNLDIRLDIDEKVNKVYVDPRKFKQIIYNLLSNAVKFTPVGGNISVRLWKESTAGDKFKFSVKDSGVGIAEEDKKKLFTPFEQLDSTSSRKDEGTGLGLTMVKRLTELHKGTVDVESEPGQGSCFTITMPYISDEFYTTLKIFE